MAKPANGGDKHIDVIEPEGREYSLYHAVREEKEGKLTKLTAHCGGESNVATGKGAEEVEGATAAGFALAAGIIRSPELLADEIKHALFVVVRHTHGHTSPADGNGSEGAEGNEPPMGAHLKLNLSKAVLEKLATEHAWPAWLTAIAEAMRKYGGFVGDTGNTGKVEGKLVGGFAIETESPASQTSWAGTPNLDEQWAELQNGGHENTNPSLSKIPWEDLEIVK